MTDAYPGNSTRERVSFLKGDIHAHIFIRNAVSKENPSGEESAWIMSCYDRWRPDILRAIDEFLDHHINTLEVSPEETLRLYRETALHREFHPPALVDRYYLRYFGKHIEVSPGEMKRILEWLATVYREWTPMARLRSSCEFFLTEIIMADWRFLTFMASAFLIGITGIAMSFLYR